MNLSLDLAGPRAGLRATGYLSQQAGENLSVLLRDLGRMEIAAIDLDLSQCSPVAVGALETLLDRKFRLAGDGVQLSFGHAPPTIAKVFQLMGLRPDGELPDADSRCSPGQPTSGHHV